MRTTSGRRRKRLRIFFLPFLPSIVPRENQPMDVLDRLRCTNAEGISSWRCKGRPIGRPQRVEVTFGMRGDIVSGGNCVAVVEVPSGWTWKDGVSRALSKLRQLRCRPVVFSPPSASIVAIVIGGVLATRGGSFAVRLIRFLSGFLNRLSPFWMQLTIDALIRD